ncbi:MAG: hypothetical protein LAO05_18660 [Acidobacteriia bacterium]|nr:hypothetical protein [Terriglobia bacterium]
MDRKRMNNKQLPGIGDASVDERGLRQSFGELQQWLAQIAEEYPSFAGGPNDSDMGGEVIQQPVWSVDARCAS